MVVTNMFDAMDLAGRRDQLARLLRLDNRFSEIVATWAGFGMQGEQTAPSVSVQVHDDQAPMLGVPAGTSLIRRDLHLVPDVSGPPFLAAAVTEFVYEPRLSMRLEQRRAVRSGSDLLEDVVGSVRRSVCSVITPRTGHRPGDVALRATTLLLRAGTPVSVVTETVYWQLITHRLASRSFSISGSPRERSAP
jgi:hypothetical protein